MRILPDCPFEFKPKNGKYKTHPPFILDVLETDMELYNQETNKTEKVKFFMTYKPRSVGLPKTIVMDYEHNFHKVPLQRNRKFDRLANIPELNWCLTIDRDVMKQKLINNLKVNAVNSLSRVSNILSPEFHRQVNLIANEIRTSMHQIEQNHSM